jgi:SAM-dependent methyltransferase
MPKGRGRGQEAAIVGRDNHCTKLLSLEPAAGDFTSRRSSASSRHEPPSCARSRSWETHQPHGHGHVHLDEGDWEALAVDAELEGELLLGFVTDTARWIDELRGPDAPPVRRVLDIGSGPGVGTCELARRFPDAHVIAVDGSPAMLERATRRAAEHGLDGRVSTHLAELPDGLDDLDPADVIWASMSLHHIGDETGALRVLRGRPEPSAACRRRDRRTDAGSPTTSTSVNRTC